MILALHPASYSVSTPFSFFVPYGWYGQHVLMAGGGSLGFCSGTLTVACPESGWPENGAVLPWGTACSALGHGIWYHVLLWGLRTSKRGHAQGDPL